ncbi:NUDIX domain-containing protein [Pseudonocardia thermophila]|uniref:NUDIX domain-containing protein n=1 Tax=Pseudonocardia thermophila TaxID=1848 RepID=UPI00389A4621
MLLLDSSGRLLLFRAFDPADPANTWWYTVGGAVEPGEALRSAAVREVREETGPGRRRGRPARAGLAAAGPVPVRRARPRRRGVVLHRHRRRRAGLGRHQRVHRPGGPHGPRAPLVEHGRAGHHVRGRVAAAAGGAAAHRPDPHGRTAAAGRALSPPPPPRGPCHRVGSCPSSSSSATARPSGRGRAGTPGAPTCR